MFLEDVWGDWKLENGRVVELESPVYYFVNGGLSWVILKEELRVHSDMDDDDPGIPLKPQQVTFVCTDLSEWVYLEGKDGTKGWLRVKDMCIPSLDNRKTEEIFDGLSIYD